MQDTKSLYKALPKGLLFLSISSRILIRNLLLESQNETIVIQTNWDGAPFVFVHELISSIMNYHGADSSITSSLINDIICVAVEFETNESVKAELFQLITTS
jgi:hypothetical protein